MSEDFSGLSEYLSDRSEALMRLAYLLTGSAADAEDLVQSTLVRVLRHWRRVRGAESLDSYIRAVMVNERRSVLRRRASREIPVAVPGGDVVPDPTSSSDDLDLLRRALQELPHRQRVAVVLRFYEDLSEAQTAAAMGCSVGTVKSLTSRGLARLQRESTVEEVPNAHR